MIKVNGVEVRLKGFDTIDAIGGKPSKNVVTEEEILEYIDQISQGNPGKTLTLLELSKDKDPNYIGIRYSLTGGQPFERIRRITGYLVGTMDKWNDAKKAEEHDRVKHSTSMEAIEE